MAFYAFLPLNSYLPSPHQKKISTGYFENPFSNYRDNIQHKQKLSQNDDIEHLEGAIKNPTFWPF